MYVCVQNIGGDFSDAVDGLHIDYNCSGGHAIGAGRKHAWVSEGQM